MELAILLIAVATLVGLTGFAVYSALALRDLNRRYLALSGRVAVIEVMAADTAKSLASLDAHVERWVDHIAAEKPPAASPSSPA